MRKTDHAADDHDHARATVHRIHPELATTWVTEEEAQLRAAKAMLAGHTAHIAHLPLEFLTALRDGHPDEPSTITAGGQAVTLIPAEPGGRVDPDGELAAWRQLRDTMTAIESAFDSGHARHLNGWVRTGLPHQIAIVAWVHNGRLIRAQGPNCTARHRDTARRNTPPRPSHSARPQTTCGPDSSLGGTG